MIHSMKIAIGFLLTPAYHRWVTPLFFLLMSLMSLAGALISQYVYGLNPCILCIYQRIPYAVAAVLSLVLLFRSRCPYGSRFLLAMIALSFLTGAAIALFHTGVEYGWWQGTDACGSAMQASSIEELRQQILQAPAVRCDEAPFYFLGLSMAGWNMLWSAALGVAAFIALFARIKRGKNA